MQAPARSFVLVLGLVSLSARPSRAADVQAGPADYREKVAALQPGDTLHLGAGTYTDLLSISGKNGRADAWITITGPESGAPAIFEADSGPCCNTIEIRSSSYIALEHLVVDGKNVAGAFGVNASNGPVHHITIEGCNFLNHDNGQQTVAISTKVTTWSWIIRGNRIVGAGTGLYLGNSDGTQPFIGGLIENNLVADTIGYNMEIKWQSGRSAQPGMPEQPVSTVIRNNVFMKNDRPSEDGDRPNVLVGGFPNSGLGAEDRYEFYGNFWFDNPRESLLQVSGRVSIHDNVFVKGGAAAINLSDHDLPLRLAHVYNNTIYATETGIAFSSSAPQGDAVIGNLVFSGNPISGSIQNQRDNVTDSVANAGSLVASPSVTLGSMDFYPLAGKCEGGALGLSQFSADTDYDKDFNGTNKGPFTFRGAYAGSGRNPGWKLAEDLKNGGGGATPAGGAGGGPGTGGTSGSGAVSSGGSAGASPGGAGGTGGTSSAGSGSGAASGASSATAASDDGGCGCRVRARERSSALLYAMALGLALCLRARRRTHFFG